MDTTAYNHIVEAHADGLYRFALKHMRDPDAAKDIVQESFMRLWLNADRVQADKAKSYLFTTAHHCMVDEVRRADRSTAFGSWHEPQRVAHQPPAGLRDTLDKALNTLTPKQRSLVLLRDLEGFSYQEIAEMIGMDITQVKVYLYRARIALRRYIGQLDLVV